MRAALRPDGEAAARSRRAKSRPCRRAATRSEEYNQAFDDLLKRPSDIDASFHFSALAAKLGYYEEAVTGTQRLLVYNSDLPRLKYELGILYHRLGSLEVARTYLAQAGSAANLPPDAQQQIASSLKDIDRRNAVNRLNGTLATGLRYQTNANASPSRSRAWWPAAFRRRFPTGS